MHARNHVGGAGARDLGQGLKLNGGVQFLDLVSRAAFFCEFGVLAGLLSFITQENQTRNQLGDAGAIELGQGLESNGSLQELYLVSCFCSVCYFGGFLVVVTLVAGLE